jgi:hypothetical protein
MFRVLKPAGRCFVEIPLKDFGFCLEAFSFSRDPESWKARALAAGPAWDRLPVAGDFKKKVLEQGFVLEREERGCRLLGPLWEALLLRAAGWRRGRRALRSSGGAGAGASSSRPVPAVAGEGALRRALSFFAGAIDVLEHRFCPSRSHGATVLFLFRKPEGFS